MLDSDIARARELLDRLVASGPKAAHVSASECHEIAETCHEALDAVAKLRRQLCDLLARAHRDGGHCTEAVGIDRSVQDAHDAIAANLNARAEADAWREILDAVDGEALRLAICKTCPSSECQIRERCTSSGTCHRSLFALAAASAGKASRAPMDRTAAVLTALAEGAFGKDPLAD
jgi:hypothetical protein